MNDHDQRAADKDALEKFVVDNQQLVELEASLSRFNFFEALGVTERELQHSRFLGYLANPQASHGLSDLFLKLLLQAAILKRGDRGFGCVDADSAILSAAEVRFEWGNIDIFIYDDLNQVAIVIENKINSKEHSEQLNRYHALVLDRYPKCHFIGIYLTRDGSAPSHEQYGALSHRDIQEIVAEVLGRPGLHLDPVIRMAINQYLELLRRHFMQDPQIAQLCGKIYSQHKRAIDLVLANKPDRRDFISERVQKLIDDEKDLIADESTRAYIRFTTDAFESPYLKGAREWTASERLVLYEFRNEPNALSLVVLLGRGEQEKRSVILKMAQEYGKPFTPEKRLYTQWNRLYKFELLEETDYDLGDAQLDLKMKDRWHEFLKTDFPLIQSAFRMYIWPS